MTVRLDLAAIREYMERASAGPWEYIDEPRGCSVSGWIMARDDELGRNEEIASIQGDGTKADGIFIARIRTDAVLMVEELAEARSELAYVRREFRDETDNMLDDKAKILNRDLIIAEQQRTIEALRAKIREMERLTTKADLLRYWDFEEPTP